MKDNQEEARTLTKDTIFAYIYAVLHSPEYRKKYEKILHTELPRIPMYEDFWKWATWGEKLLNLHLNYEEVTIYPLEREEKEIQKEDNQIENQEIAENKPKKKAILKADRVRSLVWIDETTYLKNIPEEAWHYRLGVRSALEWVLEHHSERKIRDKTVKKAVEEGIFTTYSFDNQKEQLIELLRKVCRVSVETVGILREMEE
jgi:predicted helicase